jgi:hypothetical protein
MNFSETSAKTGKGVEEMIEQMLLAIMQTARFPHHKDTLQLALRPDKKEEEQ